MITETPEVAVSSSRLVIIGISDETVNGRKPECTRKGWIAQMGSITLERTRRRTMTGYRQGLRPLGNLKRLTQTNEEKSYGYDVRLLLFRDKKSGEKYYRAFLDHAKKNPPPFLIEIMLLYIPKTISAEKYAVVIPNERTDMRPAYQEWAIDAIRSCNDTLRIHGSTDHKYKELHNYVEVVYQWEILAPKGFSKSSEEAKELLRDAPGEGLPALKMLGQKEVKAPPESPTPTGPWIGVLFEIGKFEEALYGRAATALLLQIAGDQTLAGSILHGGDILPDCQYWCSAVHTTSTEQARSIEQAVLASKEDRLAPSASRLLRDSDVPIGTLVYQGFVSKDGAYIGK
jgi:hypothetical protein